MRGTHKEPKDPRATSVSEGRTQLQVAISFPKQKPNPIAHTLSVASSCPKGSAANVALFPEKWMPLRPNKSATGASLPLCTQADHPQTLPPIPGNS